MDRWVCKRCFASNEGDASACATCGWPRGEVPPAEDSQLPAHLPAAAPPPARWWQPLLRYWWLLGIVIVGTFALTSYLGQARRDASGAITTAGTVALTDLRVGDCFDVPGGGTISQVTGRPCSEAHAYELFVVATDTVDATYPDDATMAAFLSNACGQTFNDYVGTSYNTTVLGILPVTPTENGWSRGDRTFFCAVFDPDNDRLTSSLRGSGR